MQFVNESKQNNQPAGGVCPMNNYIIELKKKYTEDLGRSSLEFLDTGVDLFHRHLNMESSCMHIAISTLSAGLELALKAFLAEKNLGTIFKDIPAEMRVLLTCPESIPNFFEWRRFDPDIRSDKHETIDLNDCISCFYIFFPHIKQLLMPHINFLLRRKSTSFRNIITQVEIYDLQRTGYAVLQILSLLGGDDSSRLFYYSLNDRDKKFVDTFEKIRIERVKLAIDQANESAYSLNADSAEAVITHGWDSFATRCPVCGYNGYLSGYSEIAIGEDEEGPKPSLDFFPTTFECDVCGLKLNDIEELKLANMGILYDRSEDIERWFHEHGDFSDGYLW